MRSLYLSAPETHPISITDPRFLSVALDWALIVGERWWDGTRRTRRGFGSVRAKELDLSDPRLIAAAAALAPAYLRLGGSESDRIAFGSSPAAEGGTPNGSWRRQREPCPTVLTPERWDQAARFAQATGLELFVCVGAGGCARDRKGRWKGDSFRRLLAHVESQGQKVAVWELGNEVNGFAFVHGPTARVSARRYAEDFRQFRESLEENRGTEERTSVVAGAAAAVWPVIGEPLPMTRRVAHRLGPELEMLTWHYYPYQSRRGVVGVRRVGLRSALRSRAHRSATRLAGRMRGVARSAGSGTVWLSETGHALFGGEPGISDRFVGSLWWLNHLGAMAAAGMGGVVRQALVGGDYGLLDREGMRPRPDFWCSLLWKRVMGREVYEPLKEGSSLAVYRHSRVESFEGWSALAVNMSSRRAAELDLHGSGRAWRVEGALDGKGLEINGRSLGPEDELSRSAVPGPEDVSGIVRIPAASAIFLEFGV